MIVTTFISRKINVNNHLVYKTIQHASEYSSVALVFHQEQSNSSK